MNRTSASFTAVAAFVLALSGCQCGGKSCKTDSECSGGQVCLKNVCQGTGAASDGGFVGGDGGVVDADIVSLEIAPRDVVLTTTLATPVSASFNATLRRSDGTTLPGGNNVLWTVNSRTLGDINPASGAYLASGAQGGQITVVATVTTRSGTVIKDSTTVTVKLTKDTIGPGLTPDVVTMFPTTTPGTAQQKADLVYPLDKALMPQNVFPADIQWLNGGAGDVFRVKLTKPDAVLTSYLKATDASNHFLPDAPQWRAFAQSNPDADGEVTVDRWVNGTAMAFSGDPVKVKFARSAVSGSVYYWAVGAAKVKRIDDGTNVAVDFLPNPPQGCVGCHSVSPSGRYMVGRLGGGDNFGTVYDLTADLTSATPPSLYPSNATRFFFSTWSPSEKKVMVNRNGPGGSQLALIDPATGADIPMLGTPLPTRATHPNWSPDGTAVAFMSEVSDWGADYSGGTLSTVAVTNEDTFAASQTLLAAASAPPSAGLTTLSYPQWTPDSKRVVYAHTENARARGTGRLEMVSRDGAEKTVLTSASGPEQSAFEPRMSPFDSGGYFWVAFLSRRNYGNEAVGSRNKNVPLIWVSAIKKNVVPGEDPSAVGYWLPGQDPKSSSISAYWAAKACRATGADCSVNSECCSEECRPPVSGGQAVCSPPPADRCRMEGQTCGGAGDCCPGFDCKVNVCVKGDDGIN